MQVPEGGSRQSSSHSGSPFLAEISRMTSSSSPRGRRRCRCRWRSRSGTRDRPARERFGLVGHVGHDQLRRGVVAGSCGLIAKSTALHVSSIARTPGPGGFQDGVVAGKAASTSSHLPIYRNDATDTKLKRGTGHDDPRQSVACAAKGPHRVKKQGQASADDVAGALGVSASAVRQHLTGLRVAASSLTRQARGRPGLAGRPLPLDRRRRRPVRLPRRFAHPRAPRGPRSRGPRAHRALVPPP